MKNIQISVIGTSPRNIQLTFDSTLAPTLAGINAVTINYGADGSYGQQAGGQPTGLNADGSVACMAIVGTDLDPVHMDCLVTDYNGNSDESGDICYPNNGGTQGAPSAAVPGPSSADLTWSSSDPGLGSVNYWKNGDSTILVAAESAPTESHNVALNNLVGGTQYNYTCQTDFVDPTLPTQVSAQASFNTPPDSGPAPVPGRLGVSVRPQWVPPRGHATVTAQVLNGRGLPEAGVPVRFELAPGHAVGGLSADHGVTDAHGLCSTTYTAPPLLLGLRRPVTVGILVVAGTPPHTVSKVAQVGIGEGRPIQGPPGVHPLGGR